MAARRYRLYTSTLLVVVCTSGSVGHHANRWIPASGYNLH
jgi:hypothetical protein